MAAWSVPSIGVRSGQRFLLWSHGVCSSCSLARTVWSLASWWVRCLFNWPLLNIAKQYRGIAGHLAPWV